MFEYKRVLAGKMVGSISNGYGWGVGREPCLWRLRTGPETRERVASHAAVMINIPPRHNHTVTQSHSGPTVGQLSVCLVFTDGIIGHNQIIIVGCTWLTVWLIFLVLVGNDHPGDSHYHQADCVIFL